MKNLLISIAMAPVVLNAQFEIGHVQHSYIDPSRNNREIPVEIFYPATVEGEGSEVAAGTFPQIIFGHGFTMGHVSYQNIWEQFVPKGYVMLFVNTETGFAPNHEDYGLDLSFALNEMIEQETFSSSILHNHLTSMHALMGHSMGGGACWLAAAQNANVNCVIGLAPAETNPSAIAAAEDVHVPIIILSGSDDAVTPPSEHHIPIYDATSSLCKYFVNIVNGSHCGYANSGSLCDFGEFGFQGITREQQQAIVYDVLDIWMQDVLMDNTIVGTDFFNYFSNTMASDLTFSCATAVENESNSFRIFPNPAFDFVVISNEFKTTIENLVITNMTGHTISTHKISSGSTLQLNLSQFSNGCYTIHLFSSDGKSSLHRLVVIH